jgi:hypothetical protein
MSGILLTADALNGLLAVTPLTARQVAAAEAAVNGTEKVITSMPMAQAAVLVPTNCAAGVTLDVRLQGRNKSTDSFTDNVVIFAQVTNASNGIQRLNIASPFKRYRTVHTVAGTGSCGWVVLLVGSKVKYAPITQVD